VYFNPGKDYKYKTKREHKAPKKAATAMQIYGNAVMIKEQVKK
jgi:hypothetical protein